MPDNKKHFTWPQKVLFRHCDPAGIVFYPQYFEMINDAVEALFRERLEWPFEKMHETNGGPTVALEALFHAPSRHGDQLDLHMTILKVGRTSLTLHTEAKADSEPRFETKHTMVCIDEAGKSTPWPKPVRSNLESMIGARQ